MPIANHPFVNRIPQADGTVLLVPGTGRPMLWIKISNPDPTQSECAALALALVDTGADDCVFPASVADQLGHNLYAVPSKIIHGINSAANAYPHTTKMDIIEMLPDGSPSNNILYSVPDTPIDFLESGSQDFILGVRNFLSNFILTVDYPNNKFSIRNPSS